MPGKMEMPTIIHITHASECLQKVATGRKENLQTCRVGGKAETKNPPGTNCLLEVDFSSPWEKVRLAV